MSQEFQAIYELGILRLDKPLSLPEQTRVTGVLKSAEAELTTSKEATPFSVEDFDRLLSELSLDVPPLPIDFSRSDIYLDHD